MVRKRRHHYVWRYYLTAWAANDVVACLRNGRVFETGTSALAVRTDFYRLQDLTQAELGFVIKVCLENSDPFLRALNAGWFPVFLGPFDLQGLAKALNAHSPQIARALDKAISNTGEDLHGAIEARGVAHLDRLRGGDIRFLESDDDRGAFLHFLCVQYFRTPKLRDSVTAALGIVPEIRPDHVWGLMSHIFATNVAFGLMRRWERTRVTLLSALAEAEFITADQPVINLHAVGTERLQPVEKLALYYPVSPKLALHWDAEAGSFGLEGRQLGSEEIEDLNRDILSMAHEQVFARNRNVLTSLAGT